MTQHPSFQSVARTTALAAAAVSLAVGALVLVALATQHHAADRQRFKAEIEPLARTWAAAGALGERVVAPLVAEGAGVVVTDESGGSAVRIGAPIFGPDPGETVPTPGTLRRQGIAGTDYLAGTMRIGERGERFYFARPATPWPLALPLLGVLLASGLVAGLMFWLVRRSVAESAAAAAADLAEISRRVAGHAFSRETEARLKKEAGDRFGAVVDPLFTMSEALTLLKTRVADAEGQAKALLQVNPHYVVIVTAAGKVFDANPAFFAMSGLPAKKAKGASVKVLDPVMPLDPLAQHAARAASGATVQGIPYTVTAKGGRKRRVRISMRKTRVADADALAIQATDVEREQELQYQVDDFFDTFDLKVEERLQAVLAEREAARPVGNR
jgi:PAS domain S-box-containing protein